MKKAILTVFIAGLMLVTVFGVVCVSAATQKQQNIGDLEDAALGGSGSTGGFTFYGYVRDKKTGEGILDAEVTAYHYEWIDLGLLSIRIRIDDGDATTNSDGYYTLTVSSGFGNHYLKAKADGYFKSVEHSGIIIGYSSEQVDFVLRLKPESNNYDSPSQSSPIITIRSLFRHDSFLVR